MTKSSPSWVFSAKALSAGISQICYKRKLTKYMPQIWKPPLYSLVIIDIDRRRRATKADINLAQAYLMRTQYIPRKPYFSSYNENKQLENHRKSSWRQKIWQASQENAAYRIIKVSSNLWRRQERRKHHAHEGLRAAMPSAGRWSSFVAMANALSMLPRNEAQWHLHHHVVSEPNAIEHQMLCCEECSKLEKLNVCQQRPGSDNISSNASSCHN